MPLVLPPVPPACRAVTVEGELNAGAGFSHALGGGLRLWFQPIVSGWILRVIPAAGPLGAHDYAELATPPYESVSPLSLSTDFSFRAQDAAGWNPRRFKWATSPADFATLSDLYTQVMLAGATPPAPLSIQLSDEIARAAEGKLTILDVRLVPGVADQWKMAAAVSAHFSSTAHTLVEAGDGKPSPLGMLRWVRFRVEFLLPERFRVEPGVRVLPHLCGTL